MRTLPKQSGEMQEGRPTNELDSRPALRPPQFTLATLFWIVAGCSVLCAAMVSAGPIGAFALLLLVLAIIAHVAGNAIGTQLRDIGSAKLSRDDLPGGDRRAEVQFAPETQLCRRTSLTRTMLAFTAIGAVLLGVVGSAALFWLTWGHVNLPTAIVAIGSSSVLGALVGFMCSSFAQIAGGAWWQARSGVK